MNIGAGDQKLNDFWRGNKKMVKNNQDNQIQSTTLCPVYLSKKVYTHCTMGYGAKPQNLGNFREFLC